MIEEKKKLAIYHECLQCGNEFNCEIGLTCPHDSAELVPVYADALEGTTINFKYTIISMCGSGATGNVYRARHIALKRDVAVKFLHKHLVDDAEKLRRFEAEARALSDLSHPKVVKVIDYGVEPQPFIAMEYASGKRLDNVLQTVGPFPYKIAIKVFLQIADAMAFVHEKGFVHRDLKPSNIVVSKLETDSPEVKILDFGIAKLLEGDMEQNKEIIGSPPYMSPEQCSGEVVDARSDVYSLGCLMYEILTGEKPFQASTPEEYIYKHLHQLPQAPSRARKGAKIPEELDRIVCRALAKQVDFRLQSMNELIRELKAISIAHTAMAEQVDAPEEKPGLPRVLPGLVTTGGAFALHTWMGWEGSHTIQDGNFYFVNLTVLLVLFSFGYWIHCIENMLKFVSNDDYKGSFKNICLLAAISLPASPAIAYGLFLLQLLLPGAAASGWLLLGACMVLTGMGLHKTFARIATGCSADSDKDKSIKEALITLSLTTFGVLPIATIPMLSKSPLLVGGIGLTCWVISYLILYVVRLELEKSKQSFLQLAAPFAIASLLLLLCNFQLLADSPTVTLLSQKLSRQPSNADLLFSRARLYTIRKEYGLALADFTKGLELAPKNGLAWRQRAILLSDELKKYPEEAARCYQKAVDNMPNDVWSNNSLGLVKDQMGQQQEAMDAYLKVINLPQRSQSAVVINHANRSGTAFRMGDYEKSVEEGTKALKVERDDRALYWRGRAYSRLGKVDLAQADLNQIESAYPGFTFLALKLRAQFALDRKAYQECLDISNKDPDSLRYTELRQMRARALLGLGELKKARDEAIAGLDTELNNQDRVDIGESHLLLAQIQYALKDYQQAYKHCAYAFRIFPRKDIAEFRDKIKLSLPKQANTAHNENAS